ncbi:MAG: helix-turn-helix transcriptional regulator [Firmicutes bacterium]|nr:helix-turn-helix transcriptional regulator [Bacillota bacterium]
MDSETKRAIGKRLREKRENCHYTREELGEYCDLSPRFIANVECGDSTFSLDTLMTVCDVLSCSSDYLLFGIGDNTDEWSELMEKLRHLDPHYKEQATNLLQNMIEVIVKTKKIQTQSEL